MQQTKVEGLGDADYVTLTDAHINGDYVFVPNRNESWPGFIEFPILDQQQKKDLAAGKKVRVYIVGWTKKYDENCVERGDCVPVEDLSISGLVRPMNKRFDKTNEWPVEKYELVEEPIYIEVNRAPLAWYWNLTFMIAAVGIAFGIEKWLSEKEKKIQEEQV